MHSFFLSSLKNEDLKELINKVFISLNERFNADLSFQLNFDLNATSKISWII